MSKKILLALLSLGLILSIYYFFVSTSNKTASPEIPNTSLEKVICEQVTAKFGDCKRILLYDADSNLAFAESSVGIIPVLTNKEFTDFKKFIYPIMDFQEFKEEKAERGHIDWRVDNKMQKDLSMIYGFAEDDAKTIVINSEGNIQPNRFYIRDNMWVWYATVKKDKVRLPVKVTVYDENGQIIDGE